MWLPRPAFLDNALAAVDESGSGKRVLVLSSDGGGRTGTTRHEPTQATIPDAVHGRRGVCCKLCSDNRPTAVHATALLREASVDAQGIEGGWASWVEAELPIDDDSGYGTGV